MNTFFQDDDHYLGTDGVYKDERYFKCRPQRAFFTDIKKCHQFDTSVSHLFNQYLTF